MRCHSFPKIKIYGTTSSVLDPLANAADMPHNFWLEAFFHKHSLDLPQT